MFFRQKTTAGRTYLQIVENRWEDGRSRQRVIATLGRLEQLTLSDELANLLRSGSRFCESLMVLDAHEHGEVPEVSTQHLGPALIFERLWEQTGCRGVLENMLRGRKFEFPVERTIFSTVLHRLFHSGAEKRSDRAGHKWRTDQAISGVEEAELHHAYRAMAWLGEELGEEEQAGRTPFAPRTIKDKVEEELFSLRRDLFTSLDVVFFDTTSIYFQGQGGETLGQYGKSKDNRPDLRQLVVGAVLDSQGHPVCCELWPGNTTDVQSLVPVVERLKSRFHIGQVCIVADRGMFSKEAMDEVVARGWLYILGARMRSVNEVKTQVLARAGRYQEVFPRPSKRTDPSPLKVKEVVVQGRRYVVCLNEDQAKKDAADRTAIVEALRAQLRQGDKSLIGRQLPLPAVACTSRFLRVGNKGYRKFVRAEGKGFAVDEDAITREERLDGKWVLRTNTTYASVEVALKYKQLWMVEDVFRSSKSLLETRPIYHKYDATIRGHVFCSFLALVLRKELEDRLEAAGFDFEWADVVRDLDALTQTEINHENKRFMLRSTARGVCGKVFQAVGVAMPPTVCRLDSGGVP